MSVLKIEVLYTVDDIMPGGECADLIDGQIK